MMKIIAFLGSPRKDGNTDLLLQEAVKGIELSGLKVNSILKYALPTGSYLPHRYSFSR
ncbi:MAG: NADPH-dependent reductase [Nitrospirae bacterium]|nr:NADPH-dependent reductase [Nitrospirota bacterium]